MQLVAHYAGHGDTLQELADQYLRDEAEKRAGNISAVKSFEAFRAWVTIEAGFYNEYQMPDGTIRKEPKSISFAKMDDLEFSQLYKSVLDVLGTSFCSAPSQRSRQQKTQPLSFSVMRPEVTTMTKDDKDWLSDVAELGCIVCRNLGFGSTPAEIHHIRTGQGAGQRANHKRTLPLCPAHHRTGGFGVAIYAGQKTWRANTVPNWSCSIR